MDITLYNQSGETIGTAQLPENIFAVPMNADVVHQALVTAQANARVAIAHAKGRGEVRGGGKKPWKQKGTGRARHASIRSPIWKGGGVTFGPTKERNFKKKINKKMARKALFMALSSKAKDKQLFVLDNIILEHPQTKEMAVILKNLQSSLAGQGTARNPLRDSVLMGKKPTTLLIVPLMEDKVKRSANNLPNFSAMEARNLNPLEVLSHKYLILVKDSVDALSKTFN